MKRILLGIFAIALVGSAVAGATTAFFLDTETSSNNTFSSGAIDLKVDSESHYNNMVCTDIGGGEYQWQPEAGFIPEPDHYPVPGSECNGSWEETDLGPTHTFFNFEDLKPGDHGENTLSLHVYNNDAYACAVIDNMHDDDNGLTEPEAEAGDDSDGPDNGEIAEELHFFAWDDDGDNIWEDGELPLFSNINGPASDVLNGVAYPLFTPDTVAMTASTTYYIGMYWCYGEIDVDDVNNILSCDGESVSNLSQTDTLVADISFYVEQARNNPDFECPLPSNEERQFVGADFDLWTAPGNCTVTVDDDGGEDYTSIQAAIDDLGSVPDGSTICVADGEYDEFEVDRPLTIAGLTNPDLGSAKVIPSAGTVTEVAHVLSSDVTIIGLHFDGTGVEMTGSQAAVVQITGTSTNIDNVNIVHNVIENFDATAPTASNKGIQWFTEAGTGSSLTNSTFSHNRIENITAASKGAYGIQTVGDMDNVSVTYNTVSDIDGAWEAGMAFDGKEALTTSGVSVDHNHVVDGIPTFSIQVEASVDGSGIVINTNNLETLLYGGSSGTPSPATLDAEDNWFGTPAPALGVDVFVAPGTNVVDFDPSVVSAYLQN